MSTRALNLDSDCSWSCDIIRIAVHARSWPRCSDAFGSVRFGLVRNRSQPVHLVVYTLKVTFDKPLSTSSLPWGALMEVWVHRDGVQRPPGLIREATPTRPIIEQEMGEGLDHFDMPVIRKVRNQTASISLSGFGSV